MRVVVHGRIDLFEPQGALQLYVESLQPAGMGDLALRFEELKARLAAEGLFDAGTEAAAADAARRRSRSSPARPVPSGRTSPRSSARRWPLARVVLVAAQVQGADAPASIVAAFRRLERYRDGAAPARAGRARPRQVTILARGGGSLEDLWSFNDERVVRAVVAHPIPVVCGVGHEVDVTLADFAADVRAPTPVRRRRTRRARPGRDARRAAPGGHAAGRRDRRAVWRVAPPGSSPSSAAPSTASAPRRGWPRPASRWACCSTGRRERWPPASRRDRARLDRAAVPCRADRRDGAPARRPSLDAATRGARRARAAGHPRPWLRDRPTPGRTARSSARRRTRRPGTGSNPGRCMARCRATLPTTRPG